jgi:hypothetical protein
MDRFLDRELLLRLTGSSPSVADNVALNWRAGRGNRGVPNSGRFHRGNLMRVPPGRISNGFIRNITDPGRPFLMGTSKELKELTFTFRTIGAVAAG